MSTTMNRVRRVVMTSALAGTTAVVSACPISPRQEVDIGRQYAAEINRQLPLVRDAEVNRYLNLLGQELVRYVDRPEIPYTFYVVNTDAVNAFAVPGGFVYINRGLIEATSTLSELAGVVAHEIAHVDQRHGAEQIERIQRANIGLTAAFVLLGRPPTGLERLAVDLAGMAVFARYSREAEREADVYAIRYLRSAGIHPMGLVTFFERLLEERRRRPSVVEQWFATHPLTESRIRETQAMVEQIPRAERDLMTVTTTPYQQFKARLRQYPAPPPEFRAR